MTVSPILSRYSGVGGVPSPEDSAAHNSPAPDSPAVDSPASSSPTADSRQTVITAWHYGDPLGEQRAATTGVVVIDRSDRAVIQIPGAERLSWLHTISSQHISALGDRHSAENLSLDANGRVEEHFVMTDIDGTTWLDTEASHGVGLLTFLTKMVFWAKAEPSARPDIKVITLVGPGTLDGPVADLLGIGADTAVYDAGRLPPENPATENGFWRRMPPIGAVPGGPDTPLPVVDLLVAESALPAVWDALVDAGATMAGTWAYDALRVVGLRPRLDVDTDEKTIPHEANWIGGPQDFGAVHLDKGCYRGQETVARVHNLGKSPRRLVLLHLDGSDDHRPATGDPVTVGGRKVGRVGTVIDHFEYGPVALALVKRSIGPEIEVLVGDEHQVGARIDPDSAPEDNGVQAGRAAVERLRKGAG